MGPDALKALDTPMQSFAKMLLVALALVSRQVLGSHQHTLYEAERLLNGKYTQGFKANGMEGSFLAWGICSTRVKGAIA